MNIVGTWKGLQIEGTVKDNGYEGDPEVGTRHAGYEVDGPVSVFTPNGSDIAEDLNEKAYSEVIEAILWEI